MQPLELLGQKVSLALSDVETVDATVYAVNLTDHSLGFITPHDRRFYRHKVRDLAFLPGRRIEILNTANQRDASSEATK